MEPNSATHSVFATPGLVLLVGAHLASPHLAHCMRVCKDWMRQFEPILWRNFRPVGRRAHSSKDVLPPEMTAALIRNLPHIRTLDLSQVDEAILDVVVRGFDSPPDDSDPSTLCSNLRRLELGVCEQLARPEPTSQVLTTLLSHNHRLEHLALPYVFLEAGAVLAAISKLEHLQHLTITSFEGEGTCRETLLLLKACLHLPKLTELHFIDMELNWDEVDKNKEGDMPDVENIIEEASIARFSKSSTATKIKSLRLPSNRYGARNPLPFLLLKSDLLDLVSCEIPLFRKDADLKEIEEVVRERCPNLKHLICPCLRGEREQDGQAISAFIRGCSGLQSFTADLFSDYDAETFDSMYFNDDYSDLEPRLIISELALRHYDTLEVLDLTRCWQVFSEDQHNILSQCHQLRRFWVTDSFGEGSKVGIESTDISESYWVCSGLKELGLVLNLYPKMEDKFDILKDGTFEDEDWDDYDVEELVVKGTKQVYTQIGQMKNLEVLALDIDRSYENHMKISDFAGNLTVCSGHLDELAGLKNLRSLQLRADFWSAMGQAEVEFMYKNWPLLSEISLGCEVSELRALPHWQWLLSKRPQLRLASEYDCQQ